MSIFILSVKASNLFEDVLSLWVSLISLLRSFLVPTFPKTNREKTWEWYKERLVERFFCFLRIPFYQYSPFFNWKLDRFLPIQHFSYKMGINFLIKVASSIYLNLQILNELLLRFPIMIHRAKLKLRENKNCIFLFRNH